ncbi:MAG: hypothetical protein RJA71_22 [Actinomycetota bacterium]
MIAGRAELLAQVWQINLPKPYFERDLTALAGMDILKEPKTNQIGEHT